MLHRSSLLLAETLDHDGLKLVFSETLDHDGPKLILSWNFGPRWSEVDFPDTLDHDGPKLVFPETLDHDGLKLILPETLDHDGPKLDDYLRQKHNRELWTTVVQSSLQVDALCTLL